MIKTEKAEGKATGMVAVMKYFEMTVSQFKQEWAKLTDQDKADLKAGIGEYDPATGTASGTLTY